MFGNVNPATGGYTTTAERAKHPTTFTGFMPRLTVSFQRMNGNYGSWTGYPSGRSFLWCPNDSACGLDGGIGTFAGTIEVGGSSPIDWQKGVLVTSDGWRDYHIRWGNYSFMIHRIGVPGDPCAYYQGGSYSMGSYYFHDPEPSGYTNGENGTSSCISLAANDQRFTYFWVYGVTFGGLGDR